MPEIGSKLSRSRNTLKTNRISLLNFEERDLTLLQSDLIAVKHREWRHSMEPKDIVALEKINGKIQTTSRAVAKHFGKKHKNVLREIRRLIDYLSKYPEGQVFSRLNFEPREFLDVRGKVEEEFSMTRDGFSMLAMSFTGEMAALWKLKFIAAFNELESFVKVNHVPEADKLDSWQYARLTGKEARLHLTDTLRDHLIPAAIAQGSQNTRWTYKNYTSLLQKAFTDDTGLDIPKKDTIRDYLNVVGLAFLQHLETKLADFIMDEIEKGTNYKEVYQKSKEYAEHMAKVLGPLTKYSYLPKKGPSMRLKDMDKLLEHKEEELNGNTKKTAKKAPK